jgi:hypothetical protein
VTREWLRSTAAGPTASLSEFLRARVLANAPRRLVFDLVGGAAVAVCALWARPVGWVVLASAGLSFAMYGAWGLAERRLQPETVDTRAFVEFVWFCVRAASAGIGLLAFMAFIFALLGMALGTWIS